MPIEYYLLIAGVILMSVELAVPGFGIFGIGGLICLTGGGYFLLGGGFPALTVLLGFYLVAALVLAFCACTCRRRANGIPSCCGISSKTVLATRVAVIIRHFWASRA